MTAEVRTVDEEPKLPLPASPNDEPERIPTGCGPDRVQEWLNEVQLMPVSARRDSASSDYLDAAEFNKHRARKTTPSGPETYASLNRPSSGSHRLVKEVENHAVSPALQEDQASEASIRTSWPPSLPPGHQPNRKRSPSLFVNSEADNLDRDLRFEKRPRHKTRVDRYETKKKDWPEKTGEKKHSSRSTRKTREKQEKLRSSREVMENFTSAALPDCRVTVRLSVQESLFLDRTNLCQCVAETQTRALSVLEWKEIW